jgi:hypothetical protein
MSASSRAGTTATTPGQRSGGAQAADRDQQHVLRIDFGGDIDTRAPRGIAQDGIVQDIL